MSMTSIPNLVVDRIDEAVSSAIQFGVSAEEFKKFVARLWDDQLRKKRERDFAELSK